MVKNLVGFLAGAFLAFIYRHGAVAGRVAAGLVGLRVAGFVEVAAGRIAFGLVALLSQLALVEVLVCRTINVLTSSLVAFAVVLVIVGVD